MHVGEGYSVTSIQEAIDKAAKYGEVILVHDGTYAENINFKGKKITVRSENGPTSTIIDGNANGSVVTFNHAEDMASILDGFTITNGLSIYGGGVYFGQFSSPKIDHCVVKENTANQEGAGMYCYYFSQPAVISCVIMDNAIIESSSYGGGIYCYSRSSPTISNCTITNNETIGIICGFSSDPKIIHCVITKNSESGILCHYSSSTIVDSIISENVHGGIGIGHSTGTIDNCTIIKNTGGYSGGGIDCLNSSSFTISNCIISENTASRGAGIYCGEDTSLKVNNCIISQNNAYLQGGGVFFYCSSSSTITNCTIADNCANQGGGVYVSDTSLQINNSILWNNTPAEFDGSSSFNTSLVVRYSNIKDGYLGINNISADPLFIDPENKDYHLHKNSPCIDAGTDQEAPLIDIDGFPRPNGMGYDMGAYENTSLILAPGFNLLCLPSQYIEHYPTSASLLNFFYGYSPQIMKLQIYSAHSQDWLTYMNTTAGGSNDENFPMSTNMVFLLYTDQTEITKIIFDIPPTVHDQSDMADLLPGINLINSYSLHNWVNVSSNGHKKWAEKLFDNERAIGKGPASTSSQKFRYSIWHLKILPLTI